jgi:hypothetical protein
MSLYELDFATRVLAMIGPLDSPQNIDFSAPVPSHVQARLVGSIHADFPLPILRSWLFLS